MSAHPEIKPAGNGIENGGYQWRRLSSDAK
jgi:hypothetical protein